MLPEPFAAGTAFLNRSDEVITAHLWVIVSDPAADPERIILTNLTTRRSGSDETCVLEPGDHPFVKHPTVIHYRQARLVGLASLEKLLRNGDIRLAEGFSPEVLARIRAGFFRSPFAPRECKYLLRKQGYPDE